MFNPYETGAFARGRAEAEKVHNPLARHNILRLLAQLETDPAFRAKWWHQRRTQQWLCDAYGPAQVVVPVAVVQATLRQRRN